MEILRSQVRFKFKIKGEIKDSCGIVVDSTEARCNEDRKGDVSSVIPWLHPAACSERLISA